MLERIEFVTFDDSTNIIAVKIKIKGYSQLYNERIVFPKIIYDAIVNDIGFKGPIIKESRAREIAFVFISTFFTKRKVNIAANIASNYFAIFGFSNNINNVNEHLNINKYVLDTVLPQLEYGKKYSNCVMQHAKKILDNKQLYDI